MIYLLLIGPIVGLISSFFGVGGGIVVVPALYSIFDKIDPQIVIGTSLLMIALNSAVNVYNFVKQKHFIDKSVILYLSFTMIIGVLLGSEASRVISSSSVKLIFSIILMLSAIRMIISIISDSKRSPDNKSNSPNFNRPVLFTIGLIAGLISGISGLGGGVILVPLLINLVRLPLRSVPLYSNAVMFFGTGFGALKMSFQSSSYIFNEEILNNFQFGNVNLLIALTLFIGAIFTSKLGVKGVNKLSDKTTKILFTIMLCIFALKVFISR